jgi:hypothetical protein
MNHSDHPNKFDIEMDHSFPFILSDRRKNGWAKEETPQSMKMQILDCGWKQKVSSTIHASILGLLPLRDLSSSIHEPRSYQVAHLLGSYYLLNFHILIHSKNIQKYIPT